MALARVFEVARECDFVCISLRVAPVFIVGGNEKNVVIFQALGGMDGFELHGDVGFVIWRFVENCHLGVVVVINEVAEISEIKFLASMLSLSAQHIAEGVEVAE